MIYNEQHQILVTGNEDKEIKFFDLRSGQLTAHMAGHTEAVSALLTAQNTLTSGGHEGSIRLWDI
jgi:striatin 1/3/4